MATYPQYRSCDRCGTAQPSGYLPADARAMLPNRAASTRSHFFH
nr:hypothetical protein [Hassalia byssoidea]